MSEKAIFIASDDNVVCKEPTTTLQTTITEKQPLGDSSVLKHEEDCLSDDDDSIDSNFDDFCCGLGCNLCWPLVVFKLLYCSFSCCCTSCRCQL